MRPATYSKVFDERKRRVCGLWRRNIWYYVRLATVDEVTGKKSVKRVRLETARTVAEARTAMQDLHKDRRDHNLCPSSSEVRIWRTIGGNTSPSTSR